ncbi:hypothetical protein AS156_08610 [Bradyrhizobium macuxiense]|uniref:Uncharacterized protein n=1 Tax=Bradyrhizobium macuxiense TaxID=1755647 RepID=A0A109JQ20_9BRAD|nr:hypothetical protein AS156_08610 [Bradyrhizobium macuxiense]
MAARFTRSAVIARLAASAEASARQGFMASSKPWRRRDRGIQYAAALRFTAWPLEYWVPAFAGTTAAISDCDRPCAAEMISLARD